MAAKKRRINTRRILKSNQKATESGLLIVSVRLNIVTHFVDLNYAPFVLLNAQNQQFLVRLNQFSLSR